MVTANWSALRQRISMHKDLELEEGVSSLFFGNPNFLAVAIAAMDQTDLFRARDLGIRVSNLSSILKRLVALDMLEEGDIGANRRYGRLSSFLWDVIETAQISMRQAEQGKTWRPSLEPPGEKFWQGFMPLEVCFHPLQHKPHRLRLHIWLATRQDDEFAFGSFPVETRVQAQTKSKHHLPLIRELGMIELRDQSSDPDSPFATWYRVASPLWRIGEALYQVAAAKHEELLSRPVLDPLDIVLQQPTLEHSKDSDDLALVRSSNPEFHHFAQMETRRCSTTKSGIFVSNQIETAVINKAICGERVVSLVETGDFEHVCQACIKKLDGPPWWGRSSYNRNAFRLAAFSQLQDAIAEGRRFNPSDYEYGKTQLPVGDWYVLEHDGRLMGIKRLALSRYTIAVGPPKWGLYHADSAEVAIAIRSWFFDQSDKYGRLRDAFCYPVEDSGGS